MARMIKFPAKCAYCGRVFKPGQAFLQRDKKSRSWLCQCIECYQKRQFELKSRRAGVHVGIGDGKNPEPCDCLARVERILSGEGRGE